MDDSIEPPRQCPSCSTELRGERFCPRCGQHQRRGRLTLRGMLRTFVADVLSLERGLGHTWLGLSRRPGKVARDYVEGRTVRYIPPVRYFLLAVGLTQLVALWTGSLGEFASGLATGIAEPGNPALTADSIGAFLDRYFVVLSALVLPVLVVGTRLSVLRAAENLAEHAVFHLYVQGHLASIFGIFMALSLALQEGVAYALLSSFMPLALVYYLWAATTFFVGARLRALFGILVALVLAGACYLVIGSVLVGWLLRH